jgi:predicted NBD/HSP70 family sugar kinase
MAAKDGINMLDVKVRNRRSILELVYQEKQIPRKDIAACLGLTPAAITLITNDLIQEGILIETAKKESSARGRREVLLEINSSKFCVIGISITKNHYELTCTDLSTKTLYHKKFRTIDFHHDAGLILPAIQSTIQTDILSSSVIGKKKLLSIGICTLGLVNIDRGLSLNSYGVFHGSVDLGAFFREAFHVPVIVTNNIVSCAHAEAFLQNSSMQNKRLLFIKYGPGIGSALMTSDDYFNVYAYDAIQLAHMVSDPNGRPCICGNHGCLETIVGYENIVSEISNLVSPDFSPELYHAWNDTTPEDDVYENTVTQKMIPVFKAYDHGDNLVSTEFNRVLFHMGTAIKNAITLLNPDSVILYGEAFEHRKFRNAFMQELSAYTKSQKVNFSDYNMQLEGIGPATTAISLFFLSGGTIPE